MKFKKEFKSEDPFPKIIGQNNSKEQLKSALLMGRHVIITGAPGIGKTTLAKNVASLLPSKTFVRVQGSPDLTVEDLLGDIDPIKAMKFGPLGKEAFTPGKIFKADKGVLFFDEINRCSEKLQNSLLQVLEEKGATISGYDVDMPTDFVLIATMNPQDSSTEKLSDVFIDRFDIIQMGYPETQEFEEDIVLSKAKKTEAVFPKKLFTLIIYFVRMLRDDDNLEKKPSVRASIGLYERACANAYLRGRDTVIFDDVKDAVVSVLGHRIKLKPSVKYLKSHEEYVKEEFEDYSKKHPESKGDGL